MIAPVRCSACKNDIRIAPGGFFLSAKAESTEDCGHCHQTLPLKNVSWHFCSVKCFSRLQQCKACNGCGFKMESCDKEDSRCGACKGVGLSIAL